MAAKQAAKTLTTSVVSALEDAASVVEELQDEMTSWRDNMSSANMEHMPKFDEVSECCDSLESADLRQRVDDLVVVIGQCTEGKSFRAGCHEHVVGKKCKRCGWSGVLHIQTIYPLVEATTHFRSETEVAYIQDGCARTVFRVTGPSPTQEDIDAELVHARQYWWKEAARIAEYNATQQIPPRRPDEPEEEAMPGAEGLDATFTYPEGRKRRRPSRASRLDEATTLLEGSVNALEGKLGELRDAERNVPLTDAQSDLLSDVEIAMQDIREALDELGSVEFPGMFG